MLHCLAIGCVFVCSYAPAPEGATDAAKIKWAKGIAADFWEAIADMKYEAAAGLLSPELCKDFRNNHDGDYNLICLLGMSSLHKISCSPRSAELAPDGSEVIFIGVFTHGEEKGDYKMRIAKEGNGRWSIRYLRLKVRKEKTAEPKKP
jgi:hypothetical protein